MVEVESSAVTVGGESSAAVSAHQTSALLQYQYQTFAQAQTQVLLSPSPGIIHSTVQLSHLISQRNALI